MDRKNTNIYPKAHFTPQTGWMNDPNGLVFHNGVYELYYQYNPYGVEWNHISWGHAKSTDLVNWENLPVTLTPDEDGYLFSGCGIRNDHGMLGLPKDALLFFYTAAGHMSPESAGKGFRIMLAVSIGRDAKDLEILYDRGILEISANHHMLYKVTDFTELRNRPVHKVTLTAGEVNVKVEIC